MLVTPVPRPVTEIGGHGAGAGLRVRSRAGNRSTLRTVQPDRLWTNSWLGRLIGAILGLVLVAVSFTDGPANGPAPWHGSEALIDVGIILFAVLVNVSLWTAKLVLSDGVLTATNFAVFHKSMPIAEVTKVSQGWLPGIGMLIRGDGHRVRTLVSGWGHAAVGPRADGIRREILSLAEGARRGVAPIPLSPAIKPWHQKLGGTHRRDVG